MNVYTILSPSEVTEDLANRLKQRRLARNLTQAGLAARSGVPLGTLKKFEGLRVNIARFVYPPIGRARRAGWSRTAVRTEHPGSDA